MPQLKTKDNYNSCQYQNEQRQHLTIEYFLDENQWEQKTVDFIITETGKLLNNNPTEYEINQRINDSKTIWVPKN